MLSIVVLCTGGWTRNDAVQPRTSYDAWLAHTPTIRPTSTKKLFCVYNFIHKNESVFKCGQPSTEKNVRFQVKYALQIVSSSIASYDRAKKYNCFISYYSLFITVKMRGFKSGKRDVHWIFLIRKPSQWWSEKGKVQETIINYVLLLYLTC